MFGQFDMVGLVGLVRKNGLVDLVWYVWLGRLGMVDLVQSISFGRFGMEKWFGMFG